MESVQHSKWLGYDCYYMMYLIIIIHCVTYVYTYIQTQIHHVSSNRKMTYQTQFLYCNNDILTILKLEYCQLLMFINYGKSKYAVLSETCGIMRYYNKFP